MPSWTLAYQIEDNRTREIYYQELETLREDPGCIAFQASADFSGRIYVQVAFRESAGELARQILHRRNAQAVPAVRENPIVTTWGRDRSEIQIDLGRTQDGEAIPINSQVCIDENGQVGTRGTPIGILLSPVDSTSRTAIVRVTSGELLDSAFRSNPSPQVEGYQDPVALSREDLEQAQAQMERIPLTYLSREEARSRYQIMADEDASVFAALDAAAKVLPRPTFKTRYQRILETLKG